MSSDKTTPDKPRHIIDTVTELDDDNITRGEKEREAHRKRVELWIKSHKTRT